MNLFIEKLSWTFGIVLDRSPTSRTIGSGICDVSDETKNLFSESDTFPRVLIARVSVLLRNVSTNKRFHVKPSARACLPSKNHRGVLEASEILVGFDDSASGFDSFRKMKRTTRWMVQQHVQDDSGLHQFVDLLSHMISSQDLFKSYPE